MEKYWDRKKLKERAKEVMSGHFWAMAGTYLLLFILKEPIIEYIENLLGEIATYISMADFYDNFGPAFPALTKSTVGSILLGVASILFSIFVLNVIEISAARYFTLCSYKKYDTKSTLDPFKNNYLKNVGTILVRNIKALLWGLLFIIPGVIAGYRYWMVPYITAENPSIERKRIFAISNEVMKGEKWRTFVLQLSFIGWIIVVSLVESLAQNFLGNVVGILISIICSVALGTYQNAAYAELYGALRYKAVHENMVTREEIGAEHFAAMENQAE